MATIIKADSPALLKEAPIGTITTYTAASMDELVTNYWKDAVKERMFPIPFWKIKQFFNASNTDEVALRVTNIDDIEIVDGRWVVFDGSYEDDLINTADDGTYYFVIHESLFNGPIVIANNPRQTIKGLSKVDFPHQHIIWGRIGYDTTAKKYFCFFNVAECILKLDTGGGGDGGGAGIKIPAN